MKKKSQDHQLERDFKALKQKLYPKGKANFTRYLKRIVKDIPNYLEQHLTYRGKAFITINLWEDFPYQIGQKYRPLLETLGDFLDLKIRWVRGMNLDNEPIHSIAVTGIDRDVALLDAILRYVYYQEIILTKAYKKDLKRQLRAGTLKLPPNVKDIRQLISIFKFTLLSCFRERLLELLSSKRESMKNSDYWDYMKGKSKTIKNLLAPYLSQHGYPIAKPNKFQPNKFFNSSFLIFQKI